MKKVAYIFPGQGSQYVGMCKDLYDTYKHAKDVFDIAENTLPDVGIKRLCFDGPIDELTLTANSQVCILVASIASLAVLRESFGASHDVSFTAGLSLGELTSLVAAKCISLEDALILVRKRGELMEEASRKNPGSMASIIGLEMDKLVEICKASGAEIANLNCPGQTVLSGKTDMVEKAVELAKEKGAKRAILLNVSGPFHSSLMKDAAISFEEELKKVEFSQPEISVISNVTADIETTSEEIKENLVKQLYSPVRWIDSVRRIAASGVTDFYEIGPGAVLKGLLRRINKDLFVFNVGMLVDIEGLKVQN